VGWLLLAALGLGGYILTQMRAAQNPPAPTPTTGPVATSPAAAAVTPTAALGSSHAIMEPEPRSAAAVSSAVAGEAATMQPSTSTVGEFTDAGSTPASATHYVSPEGTVT
jgi:hypothetical protein